MIELTDASIGYPQKPVLEHVSLVIGDGDYVVVHGENGCGKSTLVKTCLGIVAPLSGTVTNTFVPAETGYLTQLNPLRFDFPATCAEVVSSGIRGARRGRRRASAQEVQERTWLSLERMGIEDLEHADFRLLSGGQRQRVLIARALASGTSLLALDEPTNELDAQATQTLLRLLGQLNEGGLTIIMVSHDRDAIAHASRAIHVAGGSLADGRGDSR